jgi:hypothetical protein
MQSPAERVVLFRGKAAECQLRAASAKTEESRRAWLICARDWNKMAEREEAEVAKPLTQLASALRSIAPNADTAS